MEPTVNGLLNLCRDFSSVNIAEKDDSDSTDSQVICYDTPRADTASVARRQLQDSAADLVATPRRSLEYMQRRMSEPMPSPRVSFDVQVAAFPPQAEQLSIPKQVKLVSQNQEALFKDLFARVPEFKVSLKRTVGEAPVCFEHNNYGVPESHVMKRDDKIVFCVQPGEEVEIFAERVHIQNSQIFQNPISAIFADTVRATNRKKGYQSFVVADGCGWGKKAKAASELVATYAQKILTEKFKWKSELTTKDVALVHLNILKEAQVELVKKKLFYEQERKIQTDLNKLKSEDIGDTTITLATIVDTKLVVTSLGDAKVFIFRKSTAGILDCIDVTSGGTLASDDPRDCGGRLSPDGADWRNIAIAIADLEPEDIILGCTDGLHPNADPLFRGKTPRDFRHTSLTWDKNEAELVMLRQRELCKALARIVETDETLPEIAANLIKYASDLTLKTKLCMLSGVKPPEDFTLFPGKEDHLSGVLAKYTPSLKTRGSFFGSKIAE